MNEWSSLTWWCVMDSDDFPFNLLCWGIMDNDDDFPLSCKDRHLVEFQIYEEYEAG